MYNFRELNKTDNYKIYSNLLNQLSECNINKSQFQSFINNLDDNHIVIIVYSTLDNYIVGSGTLTIENKLIHNCGKVGHIEDIIIDKNHKGKSLGSKLIEYLKNISIQKGCYKTILNCDDKLCPFYEKNGFIKHSIQMRIDH